MKKVLLVWLFVLILAAISCRRQASDDFGIYLLAEDRPATQLAAVDLRTLALQDQPVVGLADIISYDRHAHEMQLTETAYRRVQDLFTLPVRVDGIPFVVSAQGEPIYAGGFWTPASSLSFDGVIIPQPFSQDETKIGLFLGYPARLVFTGEDPRADPRIFEALEMAGKLK